ncbi:ATPase [Bifidobacterium sp. DSM 109958]|uniref:Sensor-like histidine kinase SenX3 n=2 Tax=Bifidobacterium moraviense TaxID=2675323 RepID=A0A7Y0HY45_9BIFI|nr:ATPase [Bifidobacterium sp. DSM 109958]
MGDSVGIVVAFGLIGLALATALGFAIAAALRDAMVRRTGNVPLTSMLGARWHRFARDHRRGSGADDEEADDLDDDTAALLSMLPICPVVVDVHDEVVRCGPEAYRFGVVRDDAIVEPRVLEEVRRIRKAGGKATFDLTTTTAGPAQEGAADERRASRPNWLKVTVGRVGDSFVVVLLDDVSDMVRFSRTRDSFIVNVSEQMLRPTLALDRVARDLKDHGDDADRVAADADEVRSIGRRMNRMVSDLMLLIRAQEPVVASSANRLSLLGQARDVVTAMAPSAKARGVRLDVSGQGDLTVNGDGDQIRAAIGKLVENAVAYSPDKGTVSVVVGPTKDGGHAVVRVVDQGCGIPKDEQERVFERFYRGRRQNERTRDGIGLGLAVVKHVALTHHGSASVWSMPGAGSTFSLTLPLAQ